MSGGVTGVAPAATSACAGAPLDREFERALSLLALDLPPEHATAAAAA
jgi:hypothetical protein